MISGLELVSFATLRLFLLIFARCVGATAFAPVFCGSEVSRLTRLSCAFLLAMLVLPSVSANAEAAAISAVVFSIPGAVRFAVAIAFEALLGAAVGCFLKVFFQGVYLAGEMIARVGGVSVMGSFNPAQGEETTAPASFLFWISLVVFAACGGFEAFLEGFLNLFFVVTPGASVLTADLVGRFAAALSSSFALGLRLCAPVVLTTAVVYLGVGINSRLFSQLNLSLISFNVNAILSLLLLFLCLGVFCQVFQTEIAYCIESLFAFG